MLPTVFIGAAIALMLIGVFLFAGTIHSKPKGGSYWKLKPLIIVPIAGAMGGLFFHFMNNLLWLQFSWKKYWLSLLVAWVI